MANAYISRLSLLLIFMLSSCSLFQPEENRQKILFEYSYGNWAWGYQKLGTYIDKVGDVYSYQYGSGDEPWQPKKEEEYSEKELLDKFSHNNTYRWTVNADTLLSMYNLIDEAAKGPYSDRINTGADGGGYSIIAYQYETKSGAYIPIKLQLTGDWSYKNLSSAAEVLLPWLIRNLGAPIGR